MEMPANPAVRGGRGEPRVEAAKLEIRRTLGERGNSVAARQSIAIWSSASVSVMRCWFSVSVLSIGVHFSRYAQRPTAESRDVYSIRSSNKTVSRIGRWFEPLQTARPKIQLASRLLVRCSSEPGRIVDRIGAKCREGLFFRDLRWRRCADRARTRAATHVGLSDRRQ